MRDTRPHCALRDAASTIESKLERLIKQDRLGKPGSPSAERRNTGEVVFISPNTVKKHLTHVYAKVDVDGRTDLAAQAARRDL